MRWIVLLALLLLACRSLPGYRSVARPGPMDPWNPTAWSGDPRCPITWDCVGPRYE